VRSDASHSDDATVRGLRILEQKDRISDLCNRATAENDPAALKSILDELKAALAEYIREARRMTLLHFVYFRIHETFSPEEMLPKGGNVTSESVTNNNVIGDVKKDVLLEDKKKAS
jgi:hypothetical protein